MTPNEHSLLDLANNLAVELLATGQSWLRRAAFGAAEERALQAVLTTAFAAMLRTVHAESAPGDYALVAHTFHTFVQQPPVADALLTIALNGTSPDLLTLRAAFAACNNGGATLPIDVDTVITVFYASLVAELVQAVSQPDNPLHNRINLARLTTLQRDLPPQLVSNRTEISDSTVQGPVVGNNSGTITVRYGDDIYHPPAPVKLSWEERQAQRNREALLTQVEAFWVKGVLHESLHNLARIELGFQTRPDVVQQPWETLVRLPNQEPRPLPAGTNIAQVFRDNHERLLILGAPGAGKTTTLLMLAEALVTTARNNAGQPLPVVFQLSTWAEQKPPLDAWLVDELRKRYNVPPKVGQELVEQEALILLLDGLDEVGPTDHERAACVDAINAFRAQHNVPLVVCSRTAEYADLQTRFQLTALEIQPLTPAQRDAYLAQAGAQLAPLRAALAHDQVLAELATSPLLLSVMTLTYRDIPIDTLAGQDATTAQRRIWRDYVADRFARPRADVTTDREQLRAWLIWLAHGMIAHGEQVFYIEYLQPTWLATRAQRRWFQHITGLSFGLTMGLDFSLVFAIVLAISSAMTLALVDGLVMGVVEELSKIGLGLVHLLLITPAFILVIALLIALFFADLLGKVDVSERNVRLKAHTGVSRTWSTKGIHLSLRNRIDADIVSMCHITPVETLFWSWERVFFWTWLISASSHSLFFGLSYVLILWLSLGPLIGLSLGLLIWLVVILTGEPSDKKAGLLSALRRDTIMLRTQPNEGIHLSLRSSIIAGRLGALAAGVFTGLNSALVLGLTFGLLGMLGGGLVGGLLGALSGLLDFGYRFGGAACAQHVVLRRLLHRRCGAPRDFAAFLEEAKQLNILTRVGGGYRFYHRLLQEHFAQDEQPQSPFTVAPILGPDDDTMTR